MKFDLEEATKCLNEFKDYFKNEIKVKFEGNETKFNELNRKLDEHIDKQKELYAERKMSLPGLEGTEKKKFSFANCIKAQIHPDRWKGVTDSDYEKEICEETAKIVMKDNNAQTGLEGGFLVPEEHTSELIDLAIAKTPVMEMGPTLLKGLRGELPIPKITGRPTMFWVGETESPTESDTKFGEIVLRAKTAGAFTKVSQRLMWQTSGVIEGIIRDQIMDSFRLGLDSSFLFGKGTDKEIKGIAKFSGLTTTARINTDDTEGGRFLIDKAAQMAMNIDVKNMLKGNLGYIMRPEVLSFMLRERVQQFTGQPADEGQPILPMSTIMSQREIEAILGYKVRTTTLIPAAKLDSGDTNSSQSTVFFGDWKQFIIGFWEGFEIRASMDAGDSSGSAFTQRQVWITAFQGIDTNIKDETGFTTVDDALSNSTEFPAVS